MTYAEWRRKSKTYASYAESATRYGIDLSACCAAAYKAGERAGADRAEDAACRAMMLRQMIVDAQTGEESEA